MNPEVSVIIPAYNTENYIAQTLTSALGQTLQNIEVIIVDDASTDSTLAIAQSFQDPRLKILSHDTNMGAGAARNTAIEAAHGKWIAVLDSDDWFALDRLQKLLSADVTEEAEFIADDLFFIQDGESLPRTTLLRESCQFFSEPVLVDAVMFTSTDIFGHRGLKLGYTKPLMKRSFLEENGLRYDASLRLGQDFWFYLACLIKGAHYYVIPEPSYYYRMRPGSLVTESAIPRLEGYQRVARDYLKKSEVQQDPELVAALTRHLKAYRQKLAYNRVVTPLKAKDWKTTFVAILQNPYFFVELPVQLQRIISRRWSYYVKGDKLAYRTTFRNPFPNQGKRKKKDDVC